ncbi:Hint domain-containing protein [Paracoccus sediminicola]|uniref:Hint domain-containing protein n=1 Tax=Paracoccus sediminicola TaxID=3017783 RepID=UPI0022F09B93|nr:Hint domain-containing protein [Paracoccus sediminicola]WBU57989.1 Hint domain-containing protein [Paracoccus sediminicola]
MAYQINAYTFDTPLIEKHNRPFLKAEGISFADAKETLIYLDDEYNIFNVTSRFKPSGQALLKEVELGGEILPEGTILTYHVHRASTLVNVDTKQLYYAFFPVTAGKRDVEPNDFGDNTTVLIIPKEGSPPFDPKGIYDYSSPNIRNPLRMEPVSIPPGYLSAPCFASGTLIDTALGPRPVETIRAGDRVVTRDRGIRPVLWAGGRQLSARHLDIAPNLRPVRIRAGALGPGCPAQDLTLSPQHRVLIRSRLARDLAGSDETLVAAKHLCALPGVSVTNPACGVSYHHLLFDRHEILSSNGCWTESLYTGPQALKSVPAGARREIRALFPELFAQDAPLRPGARQFLDGRQSRALIRRHMSCNAALYRCDS